MLPPLLKFMHIFEDKAVLTNIQSVIYPLNPSEGTPDDALAEIVLLESGPARAH